VPIAVPSPFGITLAQIWEDDDENKEEDD